MKNPETIPVRPESPDLRLSKKAEGNEIIYEALLTIDHLPYSIKIGAPKGGKLWSLVFSVGDSFGVVDRGMSFANRVMDAVAAAVVEFGKQEPGARLELEGSYEHIPYEDFSKVREGILSLLDVSPNALDGFNYQSGGFVLTVDGGQAKVGGRGIMPIRKIFTDSFTFSEFMATRDEINEMAKFLGLNIDLPHRPELRDKSEQRAKLFERAFSQRLGGYRVTRDGYDVYLDPK